MAFDQRLQAAIEQQQATRAERPEAAPACPGHSAKACTLTPEQEGQLTRSTAVRQEQERLTEVVRIYNEAADAVGQSWTSALTSIADHTQNGELCLPGYGPVDSSIAGTDRYAGRLPGPHPAWG